MKIVIGISGASGSTYAKSIIKRLVDINKIQSHTIHLIFTTNAKINWELENGPLETTELPFKVFENNDFNAPSASGSAGFDAMIICPSSMGMLARIAHGISNDLMSRSADVMLKERKKLIIIPRETPFNLIHLKNMTLLAEAGAIICPAIPSFYSLPKTIEEVAATVTDRALQLSGLEFDTYRWGDSA